MASGANSFHTCNKAERKKSTLLALSKNPKKLKDRKWNAEKEQFFYKNALEIEKIYNLTWNNH